MAKSGAIMFKYWKQGYKNVLKIDLNYFVLSKNIDKNIKIHFKSISVRKRNKKKL
jgi:hypothetical protein